MEEEYKTLADLTDVSFLHTEPHSIALVYLDANPEDYIDYFAIKIGDEVLEAFIEKDDFCIRNLVRTAIEYYLLRSECKFFFFKTDVGPVFHLESEPCLLEKKGNCYTFCDSMAKVTVYDDEDILLNPRVYYCDPKKFFKSVYMGLLEISKNNFSNYPVCYNYLKSPVIEDYLRDIDYDEDEIQIRQKIVNGILLVQRDGLFFCEGHKEDQWILLEDDIFPEIKDSKGKSVIKSFSLNGFSKWFNESKDTETGMKFAKEIKSKLRGDIDLWWEIDDPAVLIM